MERAGPDRSSYSEAHQGRLIRLTREVTVRIWIAEAHRDGEPAGTAQFGLVGEEVEKLNADLVLRDADGHVYTVRCDAANAMLLNESLKEHKTVQGRER